MCCIVDLVFTPQALKTMGYDEGDRNFGVEVPVEQQAQLWHNRWAIGGPGSNAVLRLCALSTTRSLLGCTDWHQAWLGRAGTRRVRVCCCCEPCG